MPYETKHNMNEIILTLEEAFFALRPILCGNTLLSLASIWRT
jgi:hypothetical protein